MAPWVWTMARPVGWAARSKECGKVCAMSPDHRVKHVDAAEPGLIGTCVAVASRRIAPHDYSLPPLCSAKRDNRAQKREAGRVPQIIEGSNEVHHAVHTGRARSGMFDTSPSTQVHVAHVVRATCMDEKGSMGRWAADYDKQIASVRVHAPLFTRAGPRRRFSALGDRTRRLAKRYLVLARNGPPVGVL